MAARCARRHIHGGGAYAPPPCMWFHLCLRFSLSFFHCASLGSLSFFLVVGAKEGSFARMGPAWPGTLAPERQVQGVWGTGSPREYHLGSQTRQKSPKVTFFSESWAYAALFPAAGAFFSTFLHFLVFLVCQKHEET